MRIDRVIAILKITFLPRVKVSRICALSNIPFLKRVLKIASFTCIFLHQVTISTKNTTFCNVEIKSLEDLDPNGELPQRFTSSRVGTLLKASAFAESNILRKGNLNVNSEQEKAFYRYGTLFCDSDQRS